MTAAEGSTSTMENEPDGAANSFVLRSGVRAGLKREFAFAIASQAALSAPLGRTRRSSRTLTSSPASDPNLSEPKRRRPPDPPPPPQGPVLALMAAEPTSPQPPLPTPPPQPQPDAEADPNTIIIPPESPPRRITRSMLHHTPPPPPHNATPLKPKPEPPEEKEDDRPGPALRRFTRSLLLKDKDSNDDDLSGTTTASNASSSPPPNATTSISSNKRNTNKIPTNLRQLLATGLLEGQPVKYIMRKGKVLMLSSLFLPTQCSTFLWLNSWVFWITPL